MPKALLCEVPQPAGSWLPGGRVSVKLPVAPYHQTHHPLGRELLLQISFLQLTAEISISLPFKHLGVILIAFSPAYLTLPKCF